MTAPIIPAATVHRQLPDVELLLAPGGLVAHAVRRTDDGDRLQCSTRVRRLDWWDGQPVRVCQLCAAAVVPGGARGRYWTPEPAELAAVHLHAAWQANAAAAERIAQIRTQAMGDGSALVLAESLREYRVARGLGDTPVSPAHRGGHLLGAVLGAAAPIPVATVTDDHTAALQQEARRLEAERMNLTSRSRRQELWAAKKR
jgi:hypothetical protein